MSVCAPSTPFFAQEILQRNYPKHPRLDFSDSLCVPGIKKRGHKLLDYDALRAKVKKLVEKPDKDVTKLPRAEKETEMAKAAYEQLNEQLCTELPQLLDLRVPYLDPSFEALVKIQLRFCAEAYSRMAQVQQFLDPDTREQYAQGQLDGRVEQVLQEIRELSISGTV
jgi:amphiphysin